MKKSIKMLTHFAPPPFYSTQGGDYWIAFNLDRCANCGATTQAPNAINFHESRATLEGLGSTFLPVLPPEASWADNDAEEECDACPQ